MNKPETRVRELANGQYVAEVKRKFFIFWDKWYHIDLRYGLGTWCDDELKFLKNCPKPHVVWYHSNLEIHSQCIHLDEGAAKKVVIDYLSLLGF